MRVRENCLCAIDESCSNHVLFKIKEGIADFTIHHNKPNQFVLGSTLGKLLLYDSRYPSTLVDSISSDHTSITSCIYNKTGDFDELLVSYSDSCLQVFNNFVSQNVFKGHRNEETMVN